MKFFKWAWAFVPDPAKIWVIIGASVIIFGAIAGIVYKIDKGGYDRCEAQYSSAALEAKDKARKEILKLEEKYDAIRAEIISMEGENLVCGVRVEHAIDRMPGTPAGE